jgi:hypothetical protein
LKQRIAEWKKVRRLPIEERHSARVLDIIRDWLSPMNM